MTCGKLPTTACTESPLLREPATAVLATCPSCMTKRSAALGEAGHCNNFVVRRKRNSVGAEGWNTSGWMGDKWHLSDQIYVGSGSAMDAASSLHDHVGSLLRRHPKLRLGVVDSQGELLHREQFGPERLLGRWVALSNVTVHVIDWLQWGSYKKPRESTDARSQCIRSQAATDGADEATLNCFASAESTALGSPDAAPISVCKEYTEDLVHFVPPGPADVATTAALGGWGGVCTTWLKAWEAVPRAAKRAHRRGYVFWAQFEVGQALSNPFCGQFVCIEKLKKAIEASNAKMTKLEAGTRIAEPYTLFGPLGSLRKRELEDSQVPTRGSCIRQHLNGSTMYARNLTLGWYALLWRVVRKSHGAMCAHRRLDGCTGRRFARHAYRSNGIKPTRCVG